MHTQAAKTAEVQSLAEAFARHNPLSRFPPEGLRSPLTASTMEIYCYSGVFTVMFMGTYGQ